METSRQLQSATWRKSSYSSSSGGDCVECAPLGGADRVAMRDSKNPGGAVVTVSRDAFDLFVAGLS